MDIGTAKVTGDERARVKHHLIDVVRPDESLSLAQFRDMATAALNDIWSCGRLPFLVGGTGLYVRALLEGWAVPEVPPNEALRKRLYARAEREGAESLHRELEEIDPGAAEASTRATCGVLFAHSRCVSRRAGASQTCKLARIRTMPRSGWG